MTLIAQAYRMGNPTAVLVFEYSFLVFGSLCAFLLWDTATNALAGFGIIVIVASGVLLALSQRAKAKAKDPVVL